MGSKSKAFVWFFLLLLVVTGIDQYSKFFAHDFLSPGYPFVVTSFLNLVVVYNRGAAFGFLNEQGGWQIVFFSAIAFLVLAYLVYHIWSEAWQSRIIVAAYGFIAGGAIGNLIDRIQYGFVVDFIDFHYNEWHFWVFNLADAALTLGVILLLLSVWLEKRNAEAKGPDN